MLLMSILILSGIVTAASSIGIITIQNIKESILVDNGLGAFYSAESGVEDGLYELRKNETAAAELDSTGALSNGGTWSRSIANTIQSLTSDISQNDFWNVDLYNPDTSLSSLSNPIKSLSLSWTGGGSEWIEAQIFPWDTTGTIGNPSTRLFSAASNPAVVNLQDATDTLYRLRIKALYADITDMTITAYSGLNLGGTQVSIPSYITIYSTGVYSRANQVVRAQMSQRPPLSGNFGYVLFSEEDLVK